MGWRIETRTPASRLAGIGAALLLAVLIALPYLAGRGTVQDMFSILTLLVLAQFWNLLAGYGGLVSVGQQAFVGLGGYAMFAAATFWGLDPIAALPLAALAALVAALPIAFFAFRLEGAYFAIGTWVAAEVARLSMATWKGLGGGTGTSLPREALRQLSLAPLVESVTGARAAAARDILAYWLALALAVATIGGIYALLRSRRGLALAAVRDNPGAAGSVGVDAASIKWLVFLVAAFGTGLCGALIYLQNARISPNAAFSVQDWTAYVIFVTVIGGIGTIEGPILGVLVFYALQSTLSGYGSWYLITLGLIGIAIMLFAPRGLWGLFSARTGIHLFPVQRRLRGGPPSKEA